MEGGGGAVGDNFLIGCAVQALGGCCALLCGAMFGLPKGARVRRVQAGVPALTTAPAQASKALRC